MKLQRMASLDHNRGLLKQVQPDLSGEKVTHRKMFVENGLYKKHNHLEHKVFDQSGSPVQHDQYFRKAVDQFVHDSPHKGMRTNDVNEYKANVMMEKFSKQNTQVESKSKISVEYMRDITGNKHMSESKIKLLISFIE